MSELVQCGVVVSLRDWKSIIFHWLLCLRNVFRKRLGSFWPFSEERHREPACYRERSGALTIASGVWDGGGPGAISMGVCLDAGSWSFTPRWLSNRTATMILTLESSTILSPMPGPIPSVSLTSPSEDSLPVALLWSTCAAIAKLALFVVAGGRPSTIYRQSHLTYCSCCRCFAGVAPSLPQTACRCCAQDGGELSGALHGRKRLRVQGELVPSRYVDL